MSFHGMIDEKVWDGLMMQTPNKGANYVNKDGQDYLNADGNLVRAKFKAPIRDTVKDAIGFLQHKEGQLNCEALDRSIAEGNRLLALEKKELESAFEERLDFKVTAARRKYIAQMLEQYTEELEKKREKNCYRSGDDALSDAQKGLDAAYGDLGYTPSTNIQKAGLGGSTMVYLTIGAIAFAGFFVVKSMLAKQKTNV